MLNGGAVTVGLPLLNCFLNGNGNGEGHTLQALAGLLAEFAAKATDEDKQKLLQILDGKRTAAPEPAKVMTPPKGGTKGASSGEGTDSREASPTGGKALR